MLSIKKIKRKSALGHCAICDGIKSYRKVFEITNDKTTLYMCVSCASAPGNVVGKFLIDREGMDLDTNDELLFSGFDLN